MSSNISFTTVPNKINFSEDIYKDTIKKTSKIKKDINSLKKVNKHVNDDMFSLNDKIKTNDAENSYNEDSLFLLNLIQTEMDEKLLKKYNININKNADNQSILMKKKF